MAFEIPQKQDEEEDHDEHKNSEVVSCGIRTAPLGAWSHGNLDAISATKCRWKTKLKETLLLNIFRRGGNTGP
jgi:hypothetical protein